MLHKPCKVIEQKNGSCKIYGNGHEIPIEYDVPEWGRDQTELSPCFDYKGNRYFLEDFIVPPSMLHAYDGYAPDSFFSGILINLDERGECVKVYTYIC